MLRSFGDGHESGLSDSTMTQLILSVTISFMAASCKELTNEKGGVDAGHHAHDGKPERARSVFAAGTANVFVKDVERGHYVIPYVTSSNKTAFDERQYYINERTPVIQFNIF